MTTSAVAVWECSCVTLLGLGFGSPGNSQNLRPERLPILLNTFLFLSVLGEVSDILFISHQEDSLFFFFFSPGWKLRHGPALHFESYT